LGKEVTKKGIRKEKERKEERGLRRKKGEKWDRDWGREASQPMPT